MSQRDQIVNVFYENKMKNDFLKKESFLIGLMIISWSVFLFYLNSWNNLIIFCTVISVLTILTVKVYDIFSQRAKKFDVLVKKIVEETTKESKKESEQYMFSFSNEKVTPEEKNIDDLTETEDDPSLFQFEIKRLKTDDSEKNWKATRLSKSSEDLARRVEERKLKMKEFNYRFKDRNSDFYFIEFLEDCYYQNSITKDTYITVYHTYIDFLNEYNPDAVKSVSDKINMENMILQLKKSKQEEREDSNKETN